MASINSGLSGRYATALFDLAQESGAVDATEKDLAVLLTAAQESADFKAFIQSPLYGKAIQQKAIEALAKEMKLSDLVTRFLGVLVAGRRLNVLEAIVRDFNALLANARGEVSAEVVSAEALSQKQIDALAKALKDTTGQNVTVDARVDESLLGGLIVKIGSRMVDSSLKTKLDNLKVAMKGVQ